MRFKNRFNKTAICLLLLLIISLTTIQDNKCLAYIMPSEQVIELMTKTVSKYKTIIITQRTQQEDGSFYNEQIFMKSPDLTGYRIIGEDTNRTSYTDTAYRALLMSNKPSTIRRFLSMLKINLDTVEYARLDNTITYRIGNKEPMSPKILIEKKRFLPLLLKYNPPGTSDEDLITIEFKDYRELDDSWFPFEITYSVDGNIIETYSIQTIETNIPIDPSYFTSKEKSGFAESRTEKEKSPVIEENRLKQIIKSFEEKYD